MFVVGDNTWELVQILSSMDVFLVKAVAGVNQLWSFFSIDS